MIQPAAPSLLAATHARSTPRPTGGGMAFALPPGEGDDASALAGSAAGDEDRHDDAAPGKLLPIDGAPTFDPWTRQTFAPAVLLPVVPTDVAATAPPIPTPRSAKFALPTPALPPLRHAPAPSAVEQNATLDPDREPAPASDADVAPEAGAPAPSPVASLANPSPATPLPPTMSEPIAGAPLLASAPRAAHSSLADPSPPRSGANSVGPILADPAPVPPTAVACTPSTMVSSSALATSALTPLESRMRADTSSSITPPVGAPAFADVAPTIVAAPVLPTSLPMPSEARRPVGTRSPMPPAPSTPAATAGTPPTIAPSPPLSSSTPFPKAPVDIVAAPSDRANASPSRPDAAEQPTTVAPWSTAAARPTLPRAVDGVPPAVTVDAATFPPSSSTPSATAILAGIALPGRPTAPASPVPARDRPLPPSSSDATSTTLPAGRPWAPPAAAAQLEPTVAPITVAPIELTPVAVPASVPAGWSAVAAEPSPAISADATINAPVPAERRREAPLAVPLPIPTAPIVPPATSAPAAIVFGAARFAAQVADDPDDPAAPIGLAAPQAIERAVSATATAQAPLDLRQERWPHAMIERIEMIRDAAADVANAADTRIRLIPDALGAIDVEVKRDGDTLNVRFHAEQAQTRTLLADAAPRLAEAAEARGLRLGQSSVGADAGTAGQGQQRQSLPDTPLRAPVSTVADAVPADDDTRLA